MAKALDRVKAAEAKYTAMGETAEKLESTLKEFQGHRGPVLCEPCVSCTGKSKRTRRTSVGLSGVCVDGRDHGRGRGPPREFFPGDYRGRCSGGLVGKLMPWEGAFSGVVWEGAVRALDALGVWWGSCRNEGGRYMQISIAADRLSTRTKVGRYAGSFLEKTVKLCFGEVSCGRIRVWPKDSLIEIGENH